MAHNKALVLRVHCIWTPEGVASPYPECSTCREFKEAETCGTQWKIGNSPDDQQICGFVVSMYIHVQYNYSYKFLVYPGGPAGLCVGNTVQWYRIGCLLWRWQKPPTPTLSSNSHFLPFLFYNPNPNTHVLSSAGPQGRVGWSPVVYPVSTTLSGVGLLSCRWLFNVWCLAI